MECLSLTDDNLKEIVKNMSEPEELLLVSKVFRSLSWYIHLLLSRPFSREEKERYEKLNIPYSICDYIPDVSIECFINTSHLNKSRYLSWACGYYIENSSDKIMAIDNKIKPRGAMLFLLGTMSETEDNVLTDIFTFKGQLEERADYFSFDNEVSTRIINQLVKEEF